jgi:hypothetical protein
MFIKNLVASFAVLFSATATIHANGYDDSKLGRSINVSVKKAKTLFTALTAAGTSVVETTEEDSVMLVNIRDLTCNFAPRGYIWAQCSFVDNGAREEDSSKSALTNDAFAIYKALVNIGVKETQRNNSPTLSSVVNVREVTCTQNARLSRFYCAVRL